MISRFVRRVFRGVRRCFPRERPKGEIDATNCIVNRRRGCRLE